MSENEKDCCEICGVAYDVGFSHCREKYCLDIVFREHPDLKRRNHQFVQEVQAIVEIPQDKPKKVYTPIKRPSLKNDPKQRLISIKSRCRKKNLDCDLTIEFVAELINSKCDYCGASEKIEVDRKDSSCGYLKDNVVAACRRCNTVKNNHTSYDDMKKLVVLMGWA